MIKKGILALAISLLAVTGSIAQVKLNQLEWNKTVHDFGEMEFGAAKITIAYTFTNRSVHDFTIRMVTSSCNCTDVKWPKTIIKPGGMGVITATFNPEGLAGKIDKEIEVFGNFSDAHSAVLHIRGNIAMPELPDSQIDTTFYPGQFGYLRFSQYQLFYGDIRGDQEATRSLMVVNDYNRPLSLGEIKTGKDYITVRADRALVEPGDTALIEVTIDASKVKDFGELSDIIYLHTKDLFFAVKSVELYYNVTYAFSDNRRDIRRAPKAQVDNTRIDLGDMNEGGKKQGKFTITNLGKNDLRILKVKSHCSCTVIGSYPDAIKKGETAEITVEFDAIFKKGPQNKVVTLFTNDPQNPIIELTVSAVIHEYE